MFANAFFVNESEILSTVNISTNDKIIDLSKLKESADEKINIPQNLKFVFGRVENFVGKGENAGNQHFLLFQQCFQRPALSMVIITPVCAAMGGCIPQQQNGEFYFCILYGIACQHLLPTHLSYSVNYCRRVQISMLTLGGHLFICLVV